MLVLLLAKTDAILKEKYCKRYAVRFFFFGNSKIIFVLLTKVIANHVVIILVNIKKGYLEGMFTRGFCSHGSDFYYCLNNVLQFFI